MSLGDVDRILVYGVTGSGKSTAAQRIAEAWTLPLTLVDELTWLPGWEPVDAEEQRRIISAITATDRWVLDSSYGDWLPFVIPRTQLIIGLDYPRWLSLSRLVRRTVMGAITKQPRCNGNVETWTQMLGPRSIVRWHFASFARKRRRMHAWAADPGGPDVLLLRSPRELDRCIAARGR